MTCRKQICKVIFLYELSLNQFSIKKNLYIQSIAEAGGGSKRAIPNLKLFLIVPKHLLLFKTNPEINYAYEFKENILYRLPLTDSVKIRLKNRKNEILV